MVFTIQHIVTIDLILIHFQVVTWLDFYDPIEISHDQVRIKQARKCRLVMSNAQQSVTTNLLIN